MRSQCMPRPFDTPTLPTTGTLFSAWQAITQDDAEVTRQHALPHAYGVLDHELGTRPRVRYLAHLRNVNEEVPA